MVSRLKKTVFEQIFKTYGTCSQCKKKVDSEELKEDVDGWCRECINALEEESEDIDEDFEEEEDEEPEPKVRKK